jgi:hypothetical protein
VTSEKLKVKRPSSAVPKSPEGDFILYFPNSEVKRIGWPLDGRFLVLSAVEASPSTNTKQNA